MKRCLLALALVLSLASAAAAASLSIVPDQTSYVTGETVTLSVVMDSGGASALGIYGQVEYDSGILLGGSSSQNALTTFGVIIWPTGTTDCGGGTCVAFNQVSGGGVSPLPVDQPAGFVISTMTFTAGALGSTNVEWTVGGPFGLDFFGLTSAPGAVVNVVPEPATAALCAFGLVALAAARRARM